MKGFKFFKTQSTQSNLENTTLLSYTKALRLIKIDKGFYFVFSLISVSDLVYLKIQILFR